MSQGDHSDGCPRPEALARFLEGPPCDDDPVLGHLRGGCRRCAEFLASLLPPSSREVDSYEFPVRRGIAAALAEAETLARARSEVREALVRVLITGKGVPLPPTPQRQWAWCELLIETAAAVRPDDLLRSTDLARLAALMADALDPAAYPAEALADLRAHAWTELGNIVRAKNDYPDAETCLARAWRHWRAGSKAPLLLARLLDVMGSLFRGMRHLDDSLAVLEAAATLYNQEGEPHRAGRVLIKIGFAHLENGEPELALDSYFAALEQLDFRREPGLILALSHNAVWAYVDAGQPELAFRLLWRIRPLYEALGSPLDRIRRWGIEAKVAQALGHLDRAEEYFRKEQEGFAAEGLPYDAALAGLDLAGLLLERGRPAEVLLLIEGMVETFAERGVYREAVSTLLLLYHAVVQGEATAALARSVREKLRDLAHARLTSESPE